MPDVKYQEDSVRLICRGLGLNSPIDKVPEGFFPFLKNVRGTVFGEITNRPGVTDLGAVVMGQTPVHSIRHLADPRNISDTYVIGTGTHVAITPTHFTYSDIDSTYSGDPLALVPYRPENSPDPWMYVTDRSRMRKIRRDGILHTIGLPAPANAPTTALGIPQYKVVSDFTNAGVWVNTGTAGSTHLLSEVTGSVTAATNATPIQITSAGHGLSTGDAILMVSVGGNTNANGGWTVTKVDANNFKLNGSVGNSAWTSGGTFTRYRTAFTIGQILYDTDPVKTGWASVAPSQPSNVGQGERLTFNGGTPETVVVQEVHAVSANTTIASLIYDAGTSGLCALVLGTAVDNIDVNSFIRNTTTADNALVLAVIAGPDGTTSLRLSTPSTWAAGNAITVMASFRAYLVNTHAAAETVSMDAMYSSVTTGTGLLSETIALDLSSLATGVPITPDDLMHISLQTDRPDLITELKVQLDVDAFINDFTRNFYTFSLRAGDLTPVVQNLASLIATRQTVIQNTIINSPIRITDTLPQNFNSLSFGDQVLALEALGFSPDDATQLVVSGTAQATAEQQGGIPLASGEFGSNTPVSAQLGLGQIQYSEVLFSLNQMLRVGTDTTRTLANVAAIRIVATVTGTLTLSMSSWWVGGGYGPDTSDPTTAAYLYRFRARHPVTNVSSNWSPATRGGIGPLRQQVLVTPYLGTPTQYPLPPSGGGSAFSGTASDFVLDIARFGGSNPSWHYVGTINNTANNVFTDIYPDSSVAGNPDSVNADYQMWPMQDIPQTGTTTKVTGTTVQGTGFNLAWAPGTRILINAVAYTIYRVILTTMMELVENAKSQTAVPWRIDNPTVLQQNFACLWEVDDTFFACGDNTNPGRLYYSKRASETTQLSFVSADGTSVDWGYLDVTSPSEPLMNGLPFNARNMLFSSDRMFEILPTGLPAQPWTYREVPQGVGLFSRWAFPMYGLKGSWIPFLSRTDVMRTDGGAPTSTTDRDLFPLFPNEGNQGVNVNGIQAPNIIPANATALRLEFYDDYAYFSYKDLTGARRTLVYSGSVDGWFWDTPGPVFFYGDEGTAPQTSQAGGSHAVYVGGADAVSGHLYQFVGDSDAGQAIACEVLTASRDQGTPREQKLYGDIMVDLDPAGRNVVLQPTINNNLGTPPLPTITSLVGRSQVVVPTYIPGTDSWRTARNIGIDISWSVVDANRPVLFIWEARFTFTSAPIIALSWEISPTTFGMRNFKSLGFYRITHISTQDFLLIVTVDGVDQTAITIPNSGGVQAMTVGRFPVYKGKIYRIRTVSSVGFQLDTRDSFIEVKEWASPSAYEELRVFSDFANVQG